MTFVEPAKPIFLSDEDKVSFAKECFAALPDVDDATVDAAYKVLNSAHDVMPTWESWRSALPDFGSKSQVEKLWQWRNSGVTLTSAQYEAAGITERMQKVMYLYSTLRVMPAQWYVSDIRNSMNGRQKAFSASAWSKMPFVYSERSKDEISNNFFNDGYGVWHNSGEFEHNGVLYRTSDSRVAAHTLYECGMDDATRAFLADTGIVEVGENAYTMCMARIDEADALVAQIGSCPSMSDIDGNAREGSARSQAQAVISKLGAWETDDGLAALGVYLDDAYDASDRANLDYKKSDRFRFGDLGKDLSGDSYDINGVYAWFKNVIRTYDSKVSNFKHSMQNMIESGEMYGFAAKTRKADEKFCQFYDTLDALEGFENYYKIQSDVDKNYYEPPASVIEGTDGLYEQSYDMYVGRFKRLHAAVDEWEARVKEVCGETESLEKSAAGKVDLHAYADVKSCLDDYDKMIVSQQSWVSEETSNLLNDTDKMLEERADVSRAWLKTQAELPKGEDVTLDDADEIHAVRDGWEKMDEDQKWFAGDKSHLEFDEYMLQLRQQGEGESRSVVVEPGDVDSGTAETEAKVVKSHAMHRLYDPNSGEHFYTASETERDAVVAAGWNYEGVAWYAPDEGTDVHRLYNPNSGDHHYTASTAETSALIDAGWRYEGVGWKSAGEGGVPVLRQYNRNAVRGSHNFTTSENEHVTLMGLGWDGEGVAWYGVRR
jgi:hypothetical protein